MFGMEKMFGGRKEESQNTPEKTAELINKGMSPDIAAVAVEDIATKQERVVSGDEKMKTMVTLIKQFAIAEDIPAEDMLGRETQYTEMLIEKGIVTRADVESFFETPKQIKDAARQAAVERMNERAEHTNKYGNKQGRFQG